MKYATISKLPFRARLAVCGLYFTAVGLLSAASWIAADGTSVWLMAACFAAQMFLLAHVIRRS